MCFEPRSYLRHILSEADYLISQVHDFEISATYCKTACSRARLGSEPRPSGSDRRGIRDRTCEAMYLAVGLTTERFMGFEPQPRPSDVPEYVSELLKRCT